MSNELCWRRLAFHDGTREYMRSVCVSAQHEPVLAHARKPVLRVERTNKQYFSSNPPSHPDKPGKGAT